MTLDTLRSVLLWSAVINYAALVLWVLLFLTPHNWLHHLYGRWFRISPEQFDAINFAGILFYKLMIWIFNLTPLIALWMIG